MLNKKQEQEMISLINEMDEKLAGKALKVIVERLRYYEDDVMDDLKKIFLLTLLTTEEITHEK